jgi:hypothetical protein
MDILGAVFHTQEEARLAYRQLQDTGISADNIGLVMRDESGDVRREEVRVANEAPVAGASLGGVLGGASGWLAATVIATSVAVPVVGPVIAAGAAAALGIAAGSGAGWLIGSLTKHGMPEPEARHLQAAVERGEVVMTVHVQNPALTGRARSIMQAAGGRAYQPD